MSHYITAKHKVSRCTATFVKVVNPRDKTEHFYQDTRQPFGKGRSLQSIEDSFTITGGYSA